MEKFEFREGDVCFAFGKKSWLSPIFAWFMRSRWSHVFVVREVTPRSTYIVETTSFESAINVIDSYLDASESKLQVWRPTRLTQEQLRAVTDACTAMYGTPYGWLQFVSLGIRALLARVGIKIPNFIRQGTICDQLVLYGYTRSDIPGLAGIDPESVETQELYELVTAARYADGAPAFEMVYDQD